MFSSHLRKIPWWGYGLTKIVFNAIHANSCGSLICFCYIQQYETFDKLVTINNTIRGMYLIHQPLNVRINFKMLIIVYFQWKSLYVTRNIYYCTSTKLQMTSFHPKLYLSSRSRLSVFFAYSFSYSVYYVYVLCIEAIISSKPLDSI